MNNWALPNRVFCDNCKRIKPFVIDYMGCAADVVCEKCQGILVTFHKKEHKEPCQEAA